VSLKRCIQEFIQGWGRIYNYKDKIIVCLSKKRAMGCLMNAQFLDGWGDGGKYINACSFTS